LLNKSIIFFLNHTDPKLLNSSIVAFTQRKINTATSIFLVKKVYGVSYYCRLKSIYEPDILFQISADS